MNVPRVLVTNDDGISSEGLRWLAAPAVELGAEVVVAAPLRDSSGASAGLAAVESEGRIVTEPRSIDGLPGVEAYAIAAAPGFIALIASRGAFGPRPDVVLSGVNRGLNTGNAVVHSGTVGAAMTARTQGSKAMAVSIAVGEHQHWETASEVVRSALPLLLESDDDVVLNVNVPNVAPHELLGTREAPLASFGTVQTTIGEVGEGFVTLAVADPPEQWEPGSDAALVAEGFATVTALTPLCAARLSAPLDAIVRAPARRSR